jgi:hypothetical protein
MGILLLNDTDEDGAHFGCQRVMRTIRQELRQRILGPIESLKIGTNWGKSPQALRLLDDATLVVINGEGTLHHGKRKGRWLLDAGKRPKYNCGKVALINAHWQENPDERAKIAKSFDLHWCRDGKSAQVLSSETGRKAHQIGDLSLFHPFAAEKTTDRHGITFSCSVYVEVAEAMAEMADATGGEHVPATKSLTPISPHLVGFKRKFRTYYAKRYEKRFRAVHQNIRLVNFDSIALLKRSSSLRGVSTASVCRSSPVRLLSQQVQTDGKYQSFSKISGYQQIDSRHRISFQKNSDAIGDTAIPNGKQFPKSRKTGV